MPGPRPTITSPTWRSGCRGVDLVLTSPLVRTVQTAQILVIAQQLEIPLRAHRSLLPDMPVGSQEALLASHLDQTLVLVGHNPSMPAMAAHLLRLPAVSPFHDSGSGARPGAGGDRPGRPPALLRPSRRAGAGGPRAVMDEARYNGLRRRAVEEGPRRRRPDRSRRGGHHRHRGHDHPHPPRRGAGGGEHPAGGAADLGGGEGFGASTSPWPTTAGGWTTRARGWSSWPGSPSASLRSPANRCAIPEPCRSSPFPRS